MNNNDIIINNESGLDGSMNSMSLFHLTRLIPTKK